MAIVTFPVACAPANQTKIVKWQEEVKLSTGEVIVVERATRFKPSGGQPFRGSGWAADTLTIRFRYPPISSKAIEWRTVRHDRTGGGGYRHPETPLVLDVDKDTGRIGLITIAGGSKGGCDEYWRYRYENSEWRDDMLPETFETRTPNLLFSSDDISTPAQITLDFKRKFETDYHRWTRYPLRFRQVGPDRCLCGTVGNPAKSGCVQKYQSIKE